MLNFWIGSLNKYCRIYALHDSRELALIRFTLFSYGNSPQTPLYMDISARERAGMLKRTLHILNITPRVPGHPAQLVSLPGEFEDGLLGDRGRDLPSKSYFADQRRWPPAGRQPAS